MRTASRQPDLTDVWSSARRLYPSVDMLVPPMAANVEVRSTFSASAEIELPAGIPGPATTSGTWTSLSKAVSLPGVIRYPGDNLVSGATKTCHLAPSHFAVPVRVTSSC